MSMSRKISVFVDREHDEIIMHPQTRFRDESQRSICTQTYDQLSEDERMQLWSAEQMHVLGATLMSQFDDGDQRTRRRSNAALTLKVST